MSVYLKKGKGWRYDFTLKGNRYTEAWFKTKTEAKRAEAKKREEVLNPTPQQQSQKTPTDTGFLTLCNNRLDHVKKYDTAEHFRHTLYHVKRWISKWGAKDCYDITPLMVENHIFERAEISNNAANKDLRYLRSLFNYGIMKKVIDCDPTENIAFLPVEKRKKYVPPKSDMMKVISAADPDTQDYLWTILMTAARVGEINSLTWDDVNFDRRYVTLWTRKKKGGNRESRDVPMLPNLFDILQKRYQLRNPEISWVFWHKYWSRKQDDWVIGPYGDRKKIMKSLCQKANVRYFRFHPIRHLTASILDDLGNPIGAIQRILGHENRRTTELYLHTVGDAERKAMEKLEDIDIFSTQLTRKPELPLNVHKEFWLRKVSRPDYEVLLKEVEEMGYAGTGKKYGVSDNAIRKWIKFYERRTETA